MSLWEITSNEMSDSAKTPLWYQVYTHQLSFKEFLDRYQNPQLFKDREVVPIFILAAMYDHDPYVESIHILQKLTTQRGITERAFRSFYLYWALGHEFSNESIISGNNLAGTFSKIQIRLPNDFSLDYLFDWIAIIVRSFFNIGTLMSESTKYQLGNMHQLNEALRYTQRINEEQFEIPRITTEKMYRLSRAHESLTEFKDFFLGKAYPSILRKYRRDLIFFNNVVYCYWPAVLKTLDLEQEFTQSEIEIIRKAHLSLYNNGDIEFFFFYIDQFIKFFQTGPLVEQLQFYLTPSKTNDRLRVHQFLSNKNPEGRREYLLTYLPVSDSQVEQFCQQIEDHGFEEAIQPYILRNRQRIEQELNINGLKLGNDTTISGTSVYLHSIDELIFHIEGKMMYAFLEEELVNIDKEHKRQNPFNRSVLPDYLFEVYDSETVESIDSTWSKILRRSINL